MRKLASLLTLCSIGLFAAGCNKADETPAPAPDVAPSVEGGSGGHAADHPEGGSTEEVPPTTNEAPPTTAETPPAPAGDNAAAPAGDNAENKGDNAGGEKKDGDAAAAPSGDNTSVDKPAEGENKPAEGGSNPQ